MKSSWNKSYAAYLFDLDGTLVDTAPDIGAALNYSLREAGLDSVPEQLTRHWIGHGSRTLIQKALDNQNAQQDPEPLLKNFIHYYSKNIANSSQPYPDVIKCLDLLTMRGARLGVVTNKLTELTLRVLEALDLKKYFDTIICGDTTPNPKPSPDPIEKALGELKLMHSECLFVGDSDTDVRAAKAAGIKVVCMKDGYNHGKDVSTLDCDGVITSFLELL
jgi:phosphoglycolate phosphatase